jgi:hypothetical protein
MVYLVGYLYRMSFLLMMTRIDIHTARLINSKNIS